MTDHSTHSPIRRTASRALIGAAIVALPLTASITYAETVVPKPPVAPAAPEAAAIAAPAAPEVPAAPLAPEAPEAPESSETIVVIDPDTASEAEIDAQIEAIEKQVEARVAQVNDKQVFIYRDIDDATKRALAKRYERVHIINRGKNRENAEIEVVIAELREGLEDMDEALRETRVELQALADSEDFKVLAMEGGPGRTIVKMTCSSDGDDVATTVEKADGTRVVKICQSRVMSNALTGLRQARKAIAENDGMTKKIRKKVLKELDEQIESWEREAR